MDIIKLRLMDLNVQAFDQESEKLDFLKSAPRLRLRYRNQSRLSLTSFNSIRLWFKSRIWLRIKLKDGEVKAQTKIQREVHTNREN